MASTAPVETGIDRSEIKIHLALAVVTAIAGFILAMFLAPPRHKNPFRIPRLDRRAAEGTAPVSTSHRPSAPSAEPAPLSYAPYSDGASSAPPAPPPVVWWDPVRRVSSTTRPPAEPSPRVAVASPPKPRPTRAPDPVATGPSIQGGAPGGRPAASTPTRPAPAARRQTTNLQDAWAAVSPAVGVIQGISEPCLGVALEPDGLFVTSYAALGHRPKARVSFKNAVINGRAIASDPVLDIVVLRLETPPPATAPLASRLPEPGEGLAYMVSPMGMPDRYAEARVVGTDSLQGTPVLRYNGLTLNVTRGAPLVAAQGEVVGVVFGRAWDVPGGAFSLAASNGAIRGLLERATAQAPDAASLLPPRPRTELEGQGARMVLGLVPSPPEAAKRNEPPLTIVPARRLGRVYLGMPFDEALSGLEGHERQYLPGGMVLHKFEGGRLQIVSFMGKVLAAGTEDPHYGSLQGAGAGMQLRHLPLDRLADHMAVVQNPENGETTVTGDGIELVAGSDGVVREIRVLPTGGGGP